MMQNLRDIKDSQQVLRERLVVFYTHSEEAMRVLSKSIGIPYSTFWGFIHGGRIGYKNIIKVSEWLDDQKNPRKPRD